MISSMISMQYIVSIVFAVSAQSLVDILRSDSLLTDSDGLRKLLKSTEQIFDDFDGFDG